MGNIGERLQKARVRAGLSLPEISTRTKIRTVLLEAIEREDFDRLPSGLLARGFLRAYAREVDLDPEEVVREFQHEIEPETTEPDVAQAGTCMEAKKDVSSRQRAWPMQFAVAAVLAALAGVVFIFLDHRSETDDRAPSDPIESVGAITETSVETGQGNEDAEDLAAGDAVPAIDSSEVDPLTLVVFPARVVWVEATADGRRVLYQLVNPGEEHIIDAREELLLRVGDAGAFDYSINGVQGRQLGASGAVRTIRITRQNYRTLQDQ